MKTTPRLSSTPNAAGIYEIRWSEMRDGKWRSMRKSTNTGEIELARIALAKHLLDRQEAPVARVTVSAVVEAYLRDWSTPRGNEKTDRYALLRPLQAFGDTDPKAIVQDDIDAYLRGRTSGKYGPAVKTQTATREVTALQAALNWGATKALMIPGRPRFLFSKPAVAERRVRWLTEAQEKDVASRVHLASTSVRAMWLMGVTYGVRKGAMMGLHFRPEQIDWTTGTVDFHEPGARRTRKRRPTVPMTPEVRAILQALHQQKGDGARVLDPATDDHFKAFMASIGYDWVTPHVLKHTAITLMLRGGAREEDVAEATQTDVATIRSVYRHFTADEKLGVFGSRRS